MCAPEHYGGFNTSDADLANHAMTCTTCGADAVGPSLVPAVPVGCECLGKDRVLALLETVPSKHDVASFGDTYGSYCAAWEDGACSPDNAGPFSAGPKHTCGTLTGCSDLWATDYDFSLNQPWCCDSWCYVDVATCTEEVQEEYGITASPSWLNVPGLYYSYGACKDDQSGPANMPFDVRFAYLKADASYATYTAATCPYIADPAPLEVDDDKHVNGEEACENKGLTEAQCGLVGCCQWSSTVSECHSDVGTNKCLSNKNSCKCKPGHFGVFDAADATGLTCEVSVASLLANVMHDRAVHACVPETDSRCMVRISHAMLANSRALPGRP